MSDLDLTEAVEMAARAFYGTRAMPMAAEKGVTIPSWERISDMHRHLAREMVVSVVEAAAPIIERQVRERIANRILDLTPYNCELRPDGSEDPIRAAYVEAIREAESIARGEQ